MKQPKRAVSLRPSQRGVTLIEVMIAVFVSAIGVLGAATLQLNALKYTNSSRMTSQASFIVYDIIDRMRANAADGELDKYQISDITSPPSSASNVLDQDLMDFATNVANLPDGDGSITVTESEVTVQVSWLDRAAGIDDAEQARRGSFSVTTQVRPVTGAGGAP